MMNFVPSVHDAATLAKSLCDICLAGAFLGCILMLIESGFVLGFGGASRTSGGPQPPVTVLKPLHNAEPALTERLTAFCQQQYGGQVQVLCGAHDANAPAVNTVRTMQREHPDWPIEIHYDPRRHGSNRKLSNLINMFPRVRHDMLLLSDSDIVVDRTYLRDIAALLAQPHVGAVTTLYHGIAGDGLWAARLSALAINTHFLPQAITALALKAAKPCFGATIALRRSTLEKIGGFGRFADELADDFAIGMAVRSAGYDVAIAPFLVGHVCFETGLRQFMLHQIRVARTVKVIDPFGYAGTILTHPFPLALLGMLSGSGAAALLAVAAVASRIALCRCVERRFGLARENYWLVPLQDLLAFAVYVASYFGATVHWRGADYRVTTDGTLIEDDPRRP